MTTNFPELASVLWSVADLLRGDYKQADYGKVILSFTLLRRLDCVLVGTKPRTSSSRARRGTTKSPTGCSRTTASSRQCKGCLPESSTAPSRPVPTNGDFKPEARSNAGIWRYVVPTINTTSAGGFGRHSEMRGGMLRHCHSARGG